jgi:hypothetical protein
MEPTPDEILLTAYLDGELAPQDRQHLEQRLADEPELRQRLIVLEETWHYLDLLEQESADVEKIEATLHVAAVSVSAVPFAMLNISRWGRRGMVFLVGLVLFIIPFQFSKQSFLDDPSFRMKVEWLDMYLAITEEGEGLELLRQLAAERVFLFPDDGTSTPLGMSDFGKEGTMFSIVGYWSETDETEQQLFYRNLQKYPTLPRETMEQIRILHRGIAESPQHAELLLTLQNYYHWYRALPLQDKTALEQFQSLEEKITAIVRLKTRYPVSLPAEIVNIQESKRLAETLAIFPFEQQERLLNEEPILIIDELKQHQQNKLWNVH